MASYLQKELSKVSFSVLEMSHFFYGGKEQYEAIKQYEAVFDKEQLFDKSNDQFLSREDYLLLSVKRGARAFEILKSNKDMLSHHSPLHGEGRMPMGRVTSNHCGFTDHYALFVQTLLAQGTPEQHREWLNKALNLEIIGTYGQTELGHGSNVRALETIATYEDATDSLIINMPTITAMKWWPGALGLLATHAVVYCRLLVHGKDLGYHAIMIQIRDDKHKPMHGIEVGDVGPKMGGNSMDAGFLYIKNVRVPRFNLLAKFQKLEKGGAYTQVPPQLGKIAYMTMMKARVMIVMGAMGYLTKGLQIVMRYTLFRRQGFEDSKKGLASGEKPILDHRILQHRLFPLVATSMALFFGSRYLDSILKTFDTAVKKAGKEIDKIDTSMLPELHATSAGMKAFGTEMALAGLEEGRKCCGGQGFTMSSGIAQLTLDYIPNVTYEGDRLPMALQTARVLLGALSGKVPKKGTFSYLSRSGNTYLNSCDHIEHLVKVWETVARNAVNKAGKMIYFSQKTKSFDKAWNNNHVHLIAAAHAHTMFQLLEAFSNGIKEAPVKAQPTLQRLCRLFALMKLVEIPVSLSYLTPAQGQAIDRAIKKILPQLRPDIVGITEAPAFSERIIHSCIARDSDDIYEALFDWSRKSPLNKPEYVETIHKQVLSKLLNAPYLAQGAKESASLNSSKL